MTMFKQLTSSQRTHSVLRLVRRLGEFHMQPTCVPPFSRTLRSIWSGRLRGGCSVVILSRHDLPCDAIAVYRQTGYVILVSRELRQCAQEWVANQLLGLVDVSAPELALAIPTGEVDRMMSARAS